MLRELSESRVSVHLNRAYARGLLFLRLIEFADPILPERQFVCGNVGFLTRQRFVIGFGFMIGHRIGRARWG